MPELSDAAIQDIATLARNGLKIETVGNTPCAIIPDDCKVVDLSNFTVNDRTERPLRIKGTCKVHDVGSFCEYYKLFHDENSRVFSDEERGTVLAVLDYHGALAGGAPRWGHHRLELTFRPSKEWTEWKAQDGKRTQQMEFAEFLEDHAPDIVSPDAATMLEVARDLSAKVDADFGSAIRMANGSVQFKFSEQVKATFGSGNLEVPERFIVSIPIYLGCDRVELTARLRYRITSGKLSFWYDLLRADNIKRQAFLTARTSITDKLAIVDLSGTPA